jgi:hypothetical protein
MLRMERLFRLLEPKSVKKKSGMDHSGQFRIFIRRFIHRQWMNVHEADAIFADAAW